MSKVRLTQQIASIVIKAVEFFAPSVVHLYKRSEWRSSFLVMCVLKN